MATQVSCVGWDVTDGRNGRAERTVWETFLESGGIAPAHHGRRPWVEMELLTPSYCASRRVEGVSALN